MKLTRPLIVFDLETTGTDVMNDRIIEIACVVLMPDGDHAGNARHERSWRVNPGIPIPEEATKVHGIKDEDVAALAPFSALAPKLADMFSRADVSGFNARGFDVPMLDMEFYRAGFVDSPLDGCKIIDSKDIFHKQEPRDLTAAAGFYLGEKLEGAHGALVDSIAASRVLLAQISRYGLPESLDELVPMFEPAEKYVDPTRKLKLVDGKPTINFGQHMGTPLEVLAKTKRDYLQWILRGEFHPKVMRAVKAAMEPKK